LGIVLGMAVTLDNNIKCDAGKVVPSLGMQHVVYGLKKMLGDLDMVAGVPMQLCFY